MTTIKEQTEQTQASVIEPKSVRVEVSNATPKQVSTLPIDSLNIEHKYQRPPTKKVQEIGENWNDELVGYPVLSLREDGSYWIIDGQHRIGGARIAGKTHLEFDVREGLTEEQEAELFDKLNGNRSYVTALDRYKARMFYGEPEAEHVTAILSSFGGSIAEKSGKWSSDPRVHCVASLFKLYEQDGGQRLTEVLSIIKESWDEIDKESTTELTVGGIAQFLSRSKKFNRDRLIRRMNEEGVAQIKRQANAHSQIFGGSGPTNFYRALVEVYNKNLPQRQRLRP